MRNLRVLDLFSGIGGFALGFERVGGFETSAFCEIDRYCQRRLAELWPGVRCFDDVTTLEGADVGPVDVVCGGFPCQDISVAGGGAGLDGQRSGLWSEIARLVGELRPRYVLVENTSNLLSGGRGGWFGRVLGDLAALGYDAEWHCLQAADVGAPHIRDRIWLLAYPHGDGEQQQAGARFEIRLGAGDLRAPHADALRQRRQVRVEASGRARTRFQPAIAGSPWWTSEPDVVRVVDGVPGRVDRVRALGSAVVPACVEVFAREIRRDWLLTQSEAAA